MRFAGRASGPTRRRRLLLIAAAGVILAALLALTFLAGIVAHREGYIRDLRLRITGLPRMLAAMSDAPQLPVLRVDMKFDRVLELREYRDRAVQRGILLEDEKEYVPAEIALGDRTVRVKMRLKGDWTDHLLGDKWSYRVKVRGGDALLGMRVFSLQHPMTRRFDREWVYHRHLRHEGILALRYEFVELVFNGENKGVYALEESFSKELLESQRRREGVILKFDETRFWNQKAGDRCWTCYDDYRLEALDAFQSGKVARDPAKQAQRDAGMRLLQAFVEGRANASEVFDVERLGRWIAINELWGARHAIRWHNLRFYYDAPAGRLEPIGFDATELMMARACAQDEPWLQRALADDAVAAVYVRELTRLSEEGAIETLEASMRKEWEAAQDTLHREWPGWESDVWPQLERNAANLRRLLATRERAVGRAWREADGSWVLHVANRTMLPVELVGYAVLDGAGTRTVTDLEPQRLRARTSEGGAFWERIELGRLASEPAAIEVLTRLVGRERPNPTPVMVLPSALPQSGGMPVAPTLEAALAAHPFLYKQSPDVLAVRPGQHVVGGDLILPDGFSLRIESGTGLAFERDAVLLVRGGGLELAGDREHRISLGPRGESWGGVFILDGKLSRWQYATVRQTTGVARGAWTPTGGVTFYRTPVELDHVRFVGSEAEDMLNVVGARARVEECEFEGGVSDAFDGDFIEGRVHQTAFREIGGDGLDVSGSAVQASDSVFLRIGDKAVSAGEDTDLRAARLRVQTARFGIVSKDLSQVEVNDVELADVRIGFAAYIKKPEYGPAIMRVEGVRLENVAERALNQTGSQMFIDGLRMPEQDVDVDALYAQEEAAGGR